MLREVYAEAAEELAQLRSRERRNIRLIRRIRARAQKWKEANPAGGGETLFQRIAALPNPARSAMALFHCCNGEVEEMASLLRLKPSAFVAAVAEARQALAPGTAFPADPLLREHRPWGGDRPKAARAVKVAGAAGESPELAAQAAADSRWHEEIESAPIPEEAALLARAVPPRPGLRKLMFQPVVLAIVLAVLVVVGVAIYVAQTRMSDFPGRETIEKMVDGSAAAQEPEVEAVAPTEAGKLDDWFVLKGFAGYNVPPQLEKAIAIGGRVLRIEGLLLAEVDLRDQSARLLVFHLADLKNGGLERGGWRIFQQEDWAVAVLRDEENAYILVFPGDSDTMPAFLDTVGK